MRAALAYDKSADQVIMLGSPMATGPAQTWAWTPQAGWHQLSPVHEPPGRTSGAMAYDDSTSQIILFGGQGDSAVNGGLPLLNDTWAWNGTDWTQVSPAASPPAFLANMDYDANSHVVLAVLSDASNKVETWQWDGTSWSQLQPSQVPVNPIGGALAFSTTVSASVLYGSQYILGYPAIGDVWTYAGNTWKDYPATSGDPIPRQGPSLAADQDGGVVMFGGGGSGFTFYNETWTWAGSWTKKSTSVSPAARMSGLMDYDTNCRLDVLYGGELTTGQQVTDFYDTWVWDGSNWTKVG